MKYMQESFFVFITSDIISIIIIIIIIIYLFI